MKRSLSWTIIYPIIGIALACILLFSLISTVILEDFVQKVSVENAKNYVTTFHSIRNYYSSNVVQKVVDSKELVATAQHQSLENSIPVPATFLIEMLDKSDKDLTITTSFTSPYPFKNRQGRLFDEFQQRAWVAINKKPDEFYVEFVQEQDKTRVRVARADRLYDQTCVNCHNSHPDSPKHDWELNDVRGILEVNTVVDEWLTYGKMINQSLMSISIISFMTVMFINFAIARRVSTPLKNITRSLSLLAQGKEESASLPPAKYYEITELQSAFSSLYDKEQQRRALTKEIETLAYYDSLTKLPNRLGFLRSLDELLNKHKEKNERITVLIIDIKRFRDINNTLGYKAGDTILLRLANRLSACTTMVDFHLARLDENKFCIAVPAKEHNGDEGSDTFFAMLIDVVSNEIIIDENKIKLVANLGATCSSNGAQSSSEMLIQANIALYVSKEKGDDITVKHQPELSNAALRRITLIKEINNAIENREFIPYYQPQFCLKTNRIIGAEALMRWKKPNGDLVRPDLFIELAEQSHLIIPMGAHIFEQATTDCQQWQNHKALAGVKVAVNISSIQFSEQNILDLTQLTLEKTGLSPSLLELEVTESAMLGDVSKVVAVLNDLKKLNIEIALDDFGTGYSSLSYLKLLPIDRLKIDREFVKDLLNNTDDQAILSMICKLATELSLNVLAEGIEEKEQLEFLDRAGCHEVQGFYFAKPMPLDDFVLFAKNHNSEHRNTPA
ncbi:EAL domain-containing protein [Vibrio sp. SNU_ST1]|uniref:EAL domain-containing protein n=1 Tax=Vibrio sp. SNU_ST1 TaxID=3064001 RepID=UPI00272CDA04|nr:EAL domain-containing protein [Vibrio sp. SNU_ST1]WKY60091.1 EAL domain-containing protein [Vibrio sp. SNU_ST1]